MLEQFALSLLGRMVLVLSRVFLRILRGRAVKHALVQCCELSLQSLVLCDVRLEGFQLLLQVLDLRLELGDLGPRVLLLPERLDVLPLLLVLHRVQLLLVRAHVLHLHEEPLRRSVLDVLPVLELLPSGR